MAEDKAGMGIVEKGVPLADVIASLPAGQQQVVRVKARELIDRELTLRGFGLTADKDTDNAGVE